MTRKTDERKAKETTHSVWTGKKYGKPQTVKSLTSESMSILRNHPTIGKLLGGAK